MNANLYGKLWETLKRGKGAVLVRIVRRIGSAPRGVGSACIVDGKGIFFGTIGGGLLEYRAVEQAKVLLDKQVTALCTITMTAKEVADEGMICGGSVELFFEPILPEDHAAVEFFSRVNELCQSGDRGTLVTRVRDNADAMASDSRMLVMQDGRVIGNMSSGQVQAHVTRPQLMSQEGSDTRIFLEPVVQNPALLLFGGGHISTFVSPIAKILGFHVTVFDDRRDFANRERFPEADEIFDMPYPAAFENISITGSSYIVIVTRGHGMDRDVLELVLQSGASPAYVGMIGSIRKRDAIFTSLLERGVPQELLNGVYSPIGLDIGAHTPEEIAVSIMAEIIRVKATGS